MLSADQEIEKLRSVVARHFTVYGTVVTPLALTFEVATPADGSVEKPFDALRQELMPQNYIPSIARERGELLVHVQRRPKQRFRGLSVNVTMLVITVITTMFFGGAYNWSQYVNEPLLSWDAILNGTVFFTIPLLAILGFHEMGHYLVAKRYRMQASLPFFLPSIPPLGTFGAFISMRDPLPNRRALLDVGASGPLVGFAIAIPVTLVGLFLTAANPHTVLPVQGQLEYPQSSIFYLFLKLFIPVPGTVALHPLAFAGWVGLFVTAINLLPAGQLDGGHIARALLGERQSLVSWIALGLLVVLSVFYAGWLIFAFLILIIGVRHPPPLNDLSRLDAGRKLVGIAAVAILLTTFVVQPFQFVQVQQGLEFETVGGQPLSILNETAALGSTANPTFAVNDTRTSQDTVHLQLDPKDLQNLKSAGFSILFTVIQIGNRSVNVNDEQVNYTASPDEPAIVHLTVTIPGSLDIVPSTWTFVIQANVATTDVEADLTVELTVT
jgi:membrane-associated protease RseP (regulator of RpoE activity)